VPNRVTAALADGREIGRQADDGPGFVARPMTRDAVEREVRMDAGERLGTRAVRRILDAVWTIEERPDLTGPLPSLS
jgi:hypothetical protein